MLFSGLLKCGICGSSMVAATAKGGKYIYYFCSKAKKEGVAACSGNRVPAKKFEDAVLEELLGRAFSYENIKSFAKGIYSEITERKKPVREIQKHIKEVDEKLARYYEAFEAGTLAPENVSDRLKVLKQEKDREEADLRSRMSLDALPKDALSKESIEGLQENLKVLLSTSTPGVIKQWLGIILEKIVLNGDEATFYGRNAGLLAMAGQKKDMRTGNSAAVRISSDVWLPVLHVNDNWEYCFKIEIDIAEKSILRFDVKSVSQWLQELATRLDGAQSLARHIGISQAHLTQHVGLLAC